MSSECKYNFKEKKTTRHFTDNLGISSDESDKFNEA